MTRLRSPVTIVSGAAVLGLFLAFGPVLEAVGAPCSRVAWPEPPEAMSEIVVSADGGVQWRCSGQVVSLVIRATPAQGSQFVGSVGGASGAWHARPSFVAVEELGSREGPGVEAVPVLEALRGVVLQI